MSYTTYLVSMEYLFFQHLLYSKGLHFLKVKEKHNLNKSVMKERESSYFEELYNIPSFNGMHLLSAPPIDERASFPKRKRET